MGQYSNSLSNRILVTGASGLVGKETIKQLIDRGYRNIELLSRNSTNHQIEVPDHVDILYTDADIRNLHPLTESVSNADIVIHTAALVSFAPQDFSAMKAINIDGTENVVNLCLEYNVKKLIHISSVSVFGSFDHENTITEDMQGAHSSKEYFYGYSKYEAEQHVWRAYYEGLDTIILNPSLILGDGDYNKSSLQIFEKVYKGLPYYPKGSTAVVDIKDVGKAVINSIEADIKGERIIISAENISYKDLLQKMASSMNKTGPQKLVPSYLTSILWRIEQVRSFIFRSQPLITKQTVKSTATTKKYDNSKSKDLLGLSYIDIDKSIKTYSRTYLKYKKSNNS